MIAQRRYPDRKRPRGMLAAFIAAAIQAMLPFFIAVAMVEATNPAFAETVPVCSSLGPTDHHDGGTGDHHAGCPICAAVAAAQAIIGPRALTAPLPVSCRSFSLSPTDAPRLASAAAASYQSRAPPAIA